MYTLAIYVYEAICEDVTGEIAFSFNYTISPQFITRGRTMCISTLGIATSYTLYIYVRPALAYRSSDYDDMLFVTIHTYTYTYTSLYNIYETHQRQYTT